MPSKLSRAAEWLRDGGGWPPDVRPTQIDRADVARLRDDLADRLRPAAPKQVLTALMTLMLHFPRPDYSQGQAKAVCLDMAQDFADVPADIVEEACREWRRTEKWFPRPAELLLRAQAMVKRRRDALADVNRVLARLERAASPPQRGNNFVAVDAAGAERKLADYIAGLRARAQAEEEAHRPAASDYLNPVRPWQREGWTPSADAPRLDDLETEEGEPA